MSHIEKKLAENQRPKGRPNFFRRKGKQSALSKKSFSFDDLRTTGTGVESASMARSKTPFRRCRVLQESVNNQRVEPSSHCKSNASVDSISDKKNASLPDPWLKENSASVELKSEGLKSCLRNGDSNENHIDLRLIRARPLAPDKEPTRNLKMQRTNQPGVIGHRVLRKALRDSAKVVSSVLINLRLKDYELVKFQCCYNINLIVIINDFSSTNGATGILDGSEDTYSSFHSPKTNINFNISLELAYVKPLENSYIL